MWQLTRSKEFYPIFSQQCFHSLLYLSICSYSHESLSFVGIRKNQNILNSNTQKSFSSFCLLAYGAHTFFLTLSLSPPLFLFYLSRIAGGVAFFDIKIKIIIRKKEEEEEETKGPFSFGYSSKFRLDSPWLTRVNSALNIPSWRNLSQKLDSIPPWPGQLRPVGWTQF